MAKPAVFAFTTAYHPFIGGAEIAIQEVASRLKDQFRFFVITARMRRDLPRREQRPEGIIIRAGFGIPLDKWLLIFLGPLAVLRELGRIAPARAIFWGMDVSTGSVAAALLKYFLRRRPLILSVQYGYGGKRLGRGRFGLIGLGYRFMLGRADALTAISTFLAGTAKKFGYRREAAVVPNGVAIERFRIGRNRRTDPAHQVIITVSRLVPKNGVDTLIRAMAEVVRQIPGVRCRIVGDGSERYNLEALARELGIAGSVQFIGEVPPAAVPGELAEADIFVRPSRSEGMGNAFVEALAAGLPIIGTPVEGILDIIQDGRTGLFTKVNDAGDCAKKIIRLLGDRELAGRLALNGRAMVEKKFSWETIASAFGRLFSAELAPRILIATPQFPPDIGGPGSYAEKLAENILARGCKVSILCYGPQRLSRPSPYNVSHGWPSGLKHLVYFLKALRLLRQCDRALVLDPVIVGFPVALAGRMLSKPIVIRVEGDFLWEWHCERTGAELILRQFYERFRDQALSLKERLMYRMARGVFRQAERIVFSSKWREDIFKLGYPSRPEQMRLIESPWPHPKPEAAKRKRLLVFAGRFIRIKNIPRFIRAFLAVAGPEWRLELIGEGPDRLQLERLIQELGAGNRVSIHPPLGQSELLGKIASAHALLLPSLSDVSPNIILDCIAAGTPFLLTRETGFCERLKNTGLFTDPLNEQDIAAKLRLLTDPQYYAAYRERLKTFKLDHSWEAIADEWLNLIRPSL